MFYYKSIIQYEGTNYSGFQWQNDLQTIQSEFNNALSLLIKCKVTTTAASRTDSGVHAIEQIVKITSEEAIELSSFVEAINKVLPAQIRCIAIEMSEGLFRPSVNTSSKEYRYFFTNQTQVSKEESQFIANISNKLDLEAMNVCILALAGKHDFCNFYSSGSNVKSTLREVFTCEFSEINPHDIFAGQKLFHIPDKVQKCYQLKIIANGFLKQMIRHIVSALWMVGSGKLSVEDFLKLLDGPKSSKQLWKVAPPNGLYLYSINY